MKMTVATVATLVLVIIAGLSLSDSEAAGKKAKPKTKPLAKTDDQPTDDPPLKVNAEGKVVLSKAEWGKRLTKTQFRVARMKGTEPPYQNAYWDSKKDGIYQCVCCRQELFDSETKFDSGTGWPSFWQPIEKEAVEYRRDNSEAEPRIEVVCSRCDAHLGHVFPDGPRPTGQRFCMNSASLKFVERTQAGKQPTTPAQANK